MSASGTSFSNVSSAKASSSNGLKRKHSSEAEQGIKERRNLNNDKINNVSSIESPKPNTNWPTDRYVMLIFNSFSLADIQKVLDLQKLPDGIPKGWHVGYCAHQGCNGKVESDMTDSGWCQGRCNSKAESLPLADVRQIFLNQLMEKTDNRAKLTEIALQSNGIFLVRREINELLDAVVRNSKDENREEGGESSKRRRLVYEETKVIKPRTGGQGSSRKRSSPRRPLLDIKVQPKVPASGVEIKSGAATNKNASKVESSRAVAINSSVADISSRKRKATDESDGGPVKRPRLDSTSSAAVLQPSSLETYFKNAKALASLRGDNPPPRRTRGPKKRIPESAPLSARLFTRETDDKSYCSSTTGSAGSDKKTSSAKVATKATKSKPEPKEEAKPKKKRGGRQRKKTPPIDFGPPSPMEEFVWPPVE